MRRLKPGPIPDELIRQTLARQRSAAPTKQRALTRSEDEDTARGGDHTAGEAGSTRRRKKRGSGNRKQPQEAVTPPHLHLMYREDEEDATVREREDDERDMPNG